MSVISSNLSTVQSLYDQGLYLQALEAGRELGDLREWPGVEGQILAGRLADRLGAMRLSASLLQRAARRYPDLPRANYHALWSILWRRGPWQVWQRYQSVARARPGEGQDDESDWLGFEAVLFSMLRDFDTAFSALDRAEAIASDTSWLRVVRCHVLHGADRYEEALAVAQSALQAAPAHTPSILAAAHSLRVLDRPAEALELLLEASQRIECPAVLYELVSLRMEAHEYELAREVLDRLAADYPLLDRYARERLATARGEALYLCGEVEQARELFESVRSPYHQAIARRLAEADPSARRVLLPVGFVKQHHVTCAPATLTSLVRYWGHEVDHLDLAEQVCYDGTPAYREREWVESQGYAVREFRVDWDSSVALLDRGIPFTLTTTDATSAHLQAVIGYDARRKTLLLREPSEPRTSEALAEELFETLRSTGPRGLAFVPPERAALLDELDLPDAAAYDHLYAIQRALAVHRRRDAEAHYNTLRAEGPQHWLTPIARRTLAAYDADATAELAATEELLALFPDDVQQLFAKLALLRGQSRRDERLQLLETICRRPQPHPIFWLLLAQELSVDQRQAPRVLKLLRRVLRRRPLETVAYYQLGETLWNGRDFAAALGCYRIAACLNDKDEYFAQTYFRAARHLNRSDQAVRLLESRFEQFRHRSANPGMTLYLAYAELDLTERSVAVLEQAIASRPQDGDLCLFAADAYARLGKRQRVKALLDQAADRTHRSAWLRAAARIALCTGNLAKSLEFWRKVLAAEPLATDAHAEVALLLATTDSRAAALAHLRQAAQKFPRNLALLRLQLEWLDDDPPAAEKVARHLVDADPLDAWAHRQLARQLAALRRNEEAQTEIDLALELMPSDAEARCVAGDIAAQLGDRAAAQAHYREALKLSIDHQRSMQGLLQLCTSQVQSRQQLDFIRGELKRQVCFGEGLYAFRWLAEGVLGPDELLAVLREAHAARPDLWHAWSVLLDQLLSMNRIDEANRLSKGCCTRFPLVPGSWRDRAKVFSARQQPDRQIAALRKALGLAPAWGLAARDLAGAYQQSGRLPEAALVMHQALTHEPLQAANHLELARILWQQQERERALKTLQQALRLDPTLPGGWQHLDDWARALDQPEAPLRFAEQLTVERPGDPQVWTVLAQLLTDPAQALQREAAARRAVELAPQSLYARDVLAETLAQLDRVDEALAVCCDPQLGELAHSALRSRRAWVEAYRGNLSAAIDVITQVLEDDPTHGWAWEHLDRWCQAARAPERYLAAAESIAQKSPHAPFAWAALAEARLRLGDRWAARQALVHQAVLTPGDNFLISRLVDLSIGDGDADAAAQWIARLRELGDSPVVAAREVQLAQIRNDRAAASRALQRTLATMDSDPWPLLAARQAMSQRTWRSDFIHQFNPALQQPSPPVGTVVAWIHISLEEGQWKKCLTWLNNSAGPTPQWYRGSEVFLSNLNGVQYRHAIASYVREHTELLRRDDATWIAAGVALADHDWHQRACEWLADWHQRGNRAAQGAYTLAATLANRGRHDEALEVHRQACQYTQDPVADMHRMWLALAALPHSVDDAAGWLRPISHITDLDYALHLHQLIEALIALELNARQTGQKVSYLTLWRTCSAAAGAWFTPFCKDHRTRLYLRAFYTRFAREQGDWTCRLLRPLLDFTL